MNKEELLQELSIKINAGEISPDEVMGHLNLAPQSSLPQQQKGSDVDKKLFTHFSITKLLYIIGAAIVVLGVIFFVGQIWGDLGSIGRISITLGLGLLVAAIGSVLLKQKPDDHIGLIFHFIGGMLIPGGAMVTLSELSVEVVSLWPVAITFGVIFAFYLLLTYIHKNTILTFFAIANGTAFIYLLTASMIDGQYYKYNDIYVYLTMIVGTSYFLLAYSFREGWNKILITALYFFGITGFLGAAYSQIFNSVGWQMLYFLILAGGLYLSVYLKSRITLIMSTIFLIAYIFYITSEYFANSIGWPITLVILGFVFIGLGYASITINKKYILQKN